MHAKGRKTAGQCAGLPYGCAAMPGLHEWAMDRRGETPRSAVRCQHCLPDLSGRPTEERSALPEGGIGG